MCGIWGHSNSQRLRQVEVLQNSAIKIMFKLPRQHSTDDLYVLSDILSLRQIVKLQLGAIVHNNVLSNKLLNTILPANSHMHQYSTRFASNCVHRGSKRPYMVVREF